MKKIFFIGLAVVMCAIAANAQCVYPTDTVKIKFKLGIPGAADGIFTVAAGKQVYFAQGNLQYQASTNTWRFAEHQYDYVGDATNGNVEVGAVKCNNANISSSYTGWIDLFGWGTAGNSTAGGEYQPYATSSTSADYVPYLTTAGEWTASKSDWGQNIVGADWRSLTKAEWVYVFNTRATGKTVNGTSNARYTMARITTGATTYVDGIILFPDDYNAGTPSGVVWGNINSTGAFTSSTTSCTAAGWTALEDAGCVFLPFTNSRTWDKPNLISITSYPADGIYWSSTRHLTKTAIYCLAFNDISTGASLYSASANNLTVSYQGTRQYGYTVRLVRDVK